MHSEKYNRGDEFLHSWIVDNPSGDTRTVNTIMLDTYLKGLSGGGQAGSNSDRHMIDVEGWDMPQKILNGARILLQQTSVVIIEMTVDTFLAIANILSANGFILWDLIDLCCFDNLLGQADGILVMKNLSKQFPALAPMHRRPFDRKLWQQAEG